MQILQTILQVYFTTYTNYTSYNQSHLSQDNLKPTSSTYKLLLAQRYLSLCLCMLRSLEGFYHVVLDV